MHLMSSNTLAVFSSDCRQATSKTSNKKQRGKSRKNKGGSNTAKVKCDVCQISVSCLKTLELHCNGRKHKKKLCEATSKANQPSPKESELNQETDLATTEEMYFNKNSSRKTRQWYQKHANYYPDHYHQEYSQNYGQYQNHENWNAHHWTNEYRNEVYVVCDQRSYGFNPRFIGFGPKGPMPNHHRRYEDREQGESLNHQRVYEDQDQEESSNHHLEYEDREHVESSSCHVYENKGESSNHRHVYEDKGESSNRRRVYEDQGKSSNRHQVNEIEASNGDSSVSKNLAVRDKNLEALKSKGSKSEDCAPKAPVKSNSENSEAKKTASKRQSPIHSPSDGERRPILTENMTDRIAHWIKPSNLKDKAEVMKLVIEFSKSKKKENLLKLQTSGENNCDRRVECLNPSTPCLEDDHSTIVITDDLWNSNSVSRRQKRSKSETLQQAGNINPFISDEGSGCSSSTPRSRNRVHRKAKSPAAKEPPTKKIRRRSSPVTSDESRLSENAQVLIEVAAEKKRKEQKNNSSKKQKCSFSECLESCENEIVSESTDSANMETTESVPALPSLDSSVVVPSLAIDNQVEEIPQVPVKQETMDFEGSNMDLPRCILETFSLQEDVHKQINGMPNQSETATLTPVESLIDLFASGNIKVKKEFDDPIIDVIRTVDPEILNRVCEGQSSPTPQGMATETCSAQNPTAVPDCSSPVQQPAVCDAITVGDAIAAGDTTDAEEASDIFPFLKTSFKNILNEIQGISKLEEEVKLNLVQADSKIQEYQALVDEWKTKKIKFQSEEENLRKQRNNLLRTLADLVEQNKYEQSTAKQIDSTSSCPIVTPDIQIIQVEAEIHRVPSTPIRNRSTSQPEAPAISEKPLPKKIKKLATVSRRNTKSSTAQDNEDIAILPPPIKPTNNIPVIDLEELDSPVEIPRTSLNGLSSRTEAIIEKFSKDKINAHDSTVNFLQFYEDYLYTCSNDYTAKRFSLKSTAPDVTYYHPKRNVSQLCVEKVRGLVFVFTICTSYKVITSFKAEDGVVFKTFHMNYAVASICKSKSLIYGGLRNGSVVVCNWKDHRELVNISEPIRSIGMTQQGRLNILVTLSISGNVSIRDADRNGLLIRYVKARSYVPVFMTVCSTSIYLSSSGVMTVLDIESGTYVTKYSFSAAYTSLAVYRDSIFTASFSGLVRCYSKEEEKAVKMYYGAGGTAITCIYADHGWVFTGNRYGIISAFKYDPNTVHSCKFGKCDFLFPRLKDLEFHALRKDHEIPSPGSLCSWRKCTFMFPLHWESEVIKSHVRSHLQ